jgi:DNA-binding transcriptional LysR family regulator
MQRWIDVRLLAAIVMLSEELNFTRAAKRLGITQSGLSRRVQALEKKHRIKLFERNNANVTLTEAGRVFVEEARLSLLHNERAMQAARAATEGQESILTIGRSPYADPFLTSALLSIHLPLLPEFKGQPAQRFRAGTCAFSSRRQARYGSGRQPRPKSQAHHKQGK